MPNIIIKNYVIKINKKLKHYEKIETLQKDQFPINPF